MSGIEIAHPWAEAPWVATSAEEQAKRDAEDAEWDRLAGAIIQVAAATNRAGRVPTRGLRVSSGEALVILPDHLRESALVGHIWT